MFNLPQFSRQTVGRSKDCLVRHVDMELERRGISVEEKMLEQDVVLGRGG